MNFLSRRVWLLAGTATMFAGGVLGVACSNNDGGKDGGPDTGTTDGTTGNDGGPGTDSGKDGSTGKDGSPPTTCEAGVTGECDIITQNCGPGKDCTAVKTDGGYTTQCTSNTTGNLTEGTACTPSSQNPCVAGLECVATSTNNGRCSKHCCFGDDSACGTAKPEGYAGRCDLVLTLDGVNPAYDVCTYSPGCEPFHQQPCATGQECSVKDSQGTASCVGFSGADAGEGASCQYANDCNADGLLCLGALDGGAGSTCIWSCYKPPGPFDAGIANLQPGYGGCPNGQTCKVSITGLPSWMGACAK
mgnify:CR=1 FL=1